MLLIENLNNTLETLVPVELKLLPTVVNLVNIANHMSVLYLSTHWCQGVATVSLTLRFIVCHQ